MYFKHYNQLQATLLPYSFDNFISEKHPVRVVDQVVESINIQPLLKTYCKEENPTYHPKMLLKVMLYAYMTGIYYSRKIEPITSRYSAHPLILRHSLSFSRLVTATSNKSSTSS